MSLFERWLTLWVALCILAGLVLGSLVPGLFGALAALEVASVRRRKMWLDRLCVQILLDRIPRQPRAARNLPDRQALTKTQLPDDVQ